MPPEAPAAHGAIVLAAGASGRLGRSKQLLRVDGETLIHRAARLALSTGPLVTLVVVGADADKVAAEVGDLDVQRVDCADWQSGMGASLRAGIGALPAACAGALVVLCDQPALDSTHLQRLCAAWQSGPDRAAASAYAGHIGVPALLPRAWFGEVQQVAGGDRGARDLLVRRHDQVAVVRNEALARDIDRSSDLAAIDR